MNKRNFTFTQVHNLEFCLLENVIATAIVNQKWVASYKVSNPFTKLGETTGTAEITIEPIDGSTENSPYKVTATCVIPDAMVETYRFLKRYRNGVPLLLRYTAANYQKRIAGTKANPLTMQIKELPQRGGIECTITGISFDPPAFE